MKKALFVCNMDSFHRNFNQPYVNRLNEHGYVVDLACLGAETFKTIRKKFNVPFGRKPLTYENIKAFQKLRDIVRADYYDLIYISTPIPGALARMALVGANHGRVVYSAHGFNFYKGNSAIKNLVFITLEKFLSRLTDCIFTMNEEDYVACQRYHFHCKEIYNVDGVGVDLSVFQKASQNEKAELRKEYHYNEDDFLLIYPAELTARKNQSLLLESMVKLKEKHQNVRLLLLGRGVNEAVYRETAKELGVNDSVDFWGYRNDVNRMLRMSDVLFSSSINEGLPINLMEALATGLPVVTTNTRGQNDLIKEGYNGFLYELNQPEVAAQKISKLIEDSILYNQVSSNAVESSKKYDISVVAPQYDKIFGI